MEKAPIAPHIVAAVSLSQVSWLTKRYPSRGSGLREAKDLEELSRLGHFLKGSSATLGLTKVKDSCEKIQRYGKKENVDGSPEDDEDVLLERITDTLKVVKQEYNEAEKALKQFYDSS